METTSKVCRSCKVEKESAGFSPSFSYKDGLHCYCRSCMSERSRAWQKKNPERSKQLKKESRERNPDGARLAQRKWNLANAEKLKEYQREYHRKQVASWRANNPDQLKMSNRKNSLFKRGITLEIFDAMMKEQGGVCAICGKGNADGRILGIDHNHGCHPAGGYSCNKCARGLLCTPCNTALHKMENDHGWHLKALAYLERYKKGT